MNNIHLNGLKKNNKNKYKYMYQYINDYSKKQCCDDLVLEPYTISLESCVLLERISSLSA